jgi:3-phenylpropionate/trans-cinnamate dioxygenase ferredoxin subunit
MRIKAADSSDVRHMHTVSIEGREILIVRTEEGLFAVEDLCPHAEQPLSTGKADGHLLTCRHHGVQIDLRTGQVVDSMGFLGLQPSNVFTVEETGGSIWIDL